MARSTTSSRQRNTQRRKKSSTALAVDFLNDLAAFNEVSASNDEDTSEEEPSADAQRGTNHQRNPSNDLPNGPDGQSTATSWRDRLRRRPPRRSRVDDIFDIPQSPEVSSSPGLRRSARLSNRFRTIDNNPETADTERRVDRDDIGSSYNDDDDDDDDDDDAVSKSGVSESRNKVSPSTPSHDGADEEPSPPRSPSQQRLISERHEDSARSRKRALEGDDPHGGVSSHIEESDDDDGSIIRPSSRQRRSRSALRKPSPQTDVPTIQQSPRQNSADGAVTAPQPETVTINGVEYVSWDAQDVDREADAENDPRTAPPESPGDRLFKEALQVLHQQENWADLAQTAHNIGQEAGSFQLVRFRSIDDIKQHISDLCTLYGAIQQQRSTGNGVDVGLLHDSEKRVELISHKAFRILSKVQQRATSGKNPNEKQALKADAHILLDQFETDVIPCLVEAAQECLKAHYLRGWLAAEGFGAVHRILLVLSSTCERIFTLKRNGVVSARDRSRALRPTLRSLLRAMERGEFEQRLQSWADQPAYPATSTTDVINLESDDDEQQEEWTEDEAIAILDGLRLFQGPDRFQQLVQRFGDRLRGRTMAEIRAKARELRDSYLDAMADSAELQTEHGRRQWAWLINV